MKVYLLLSTFLLVARSNAGPYQPGTPGIKWTEDQASIIRSKILYLWKNWKNTAKDFDFGDPGQQEPTGTNTEYVYDPERKLSTRDCGDKGLCSTYWAYDLRLGNIAFTERKAIRLAFHDCIPYDNGAGGTTGGCDGCMNFDENREGNNVLQHTAAILEKLYKEKNFPTMDGPNLSKSPFELGISRADLWAFAGILALDEAQRTTRSQCDNYNYDRTCGDNSTTCFTPFPKSTETLFKTGRIDCIPRDTASEKQQYLASQIEVGPDHSGNGQTTVKYFEDKFGIKGKESLALMGGHTLGKFSTGLNDPHIDYAWVRELDSRRNEMFTNEYYKVLSAQPALVKDGYCLGTWDGKPVKPEWHVKPQMFAEIWGYKLPISKSGQNAHLLWAPKYKRIPQCTDMKDEDWQLDLSGFWNEKQHWEEKSDTIPSPYTSFTEWCCAELESGCGATGTCPDFCGNYPIQNRIRHLSTDVGYYLKFDFDKDGLPQGCSGFNAMPNRNRWYWAYQSDLPDAVTPAGCPLQDMEDENGQEMHKSVEEYAGNQELWVNDFLSAWAKMQQNGYEKLEDGPIGYWSHKCCFDREIAFSGNDLEDGEFDEIPDAVECQKMCQETEDCQWFGYKAENKKCKLKSAKPEEFSKGPIDEYSGPAYCPTDDNLCDSYKAL